MREEKRDARERKEGIEMDMNPMVDLAFLLLTFFMLTTTFTRPQTMELIMPAKPKESDPVKEQPVKESKAFTIVLDTLDKVIWYKGLSDAKPTKTDYSKSGLRQIVATHLEQIPDLVILIKPQDGSRFANLVDVLDEMKAIAAPRYTLSEIEPYDREILKKLP